MRFFSIYSINLFPTTQFRLKLSQIEVNTGLSDAGYVEVQLPMGVGSTNIVIKGAYDLLSKMKNNEEGN